MKSKKVRIWVGVGLSLVFVVIVGGVVVMAFGGASGSL
jgi:hypothetical protein